MKRTVSETARQRNQHQKLESKILKIILFLIIVAAFAGGSVPPFAKIALEQFQPFTLVFIRFLAASLALLPFILQRKELNWKTARALAWVAVIGAMNPILLFIALQFTPSSVSPLIYAAVPLLTALYLLAFRKAAIPTQKILGIAIGFAGVAMIIVLPFLQKGAPDLKSFAGNILIFGAAVAFMLYGMTSNQKQQQLQVSPLALTFYFCIITLILAIPFAAYEVITRPVDQASV